MAKPTHEPFATMTVTRGGQYKVASELYQVQAA